MAAIVLKISIMDTHPPVWRRVVVPEKISFFDLHRVIQVIFGWEDAHLHRFEAPRKAYAIVSDPEDAPGEYLLEDRTQIGTVFGQEKWLSYTYDFGDDWRHKILFEKRLPEEKIDAARVLKAKGNNFVEDSGGVWNQQMQQETYDTALVNQKLEAMPLKNICMSAADKQKVAHIYFEKRMWKDLNEQMQEVLKELEGLEELLSPIERECEEWDSFCGESLTGKVCVKLGTKSSRELLGRLNARQAEEYSMYLQVLSDEQTTEQMLDAVAEELETHPEYNLYLLEKEDVSELKRLAAAKPEQLLTISSDAVQKGLMLGLLQIQIQDGTQAAYLFPAVDLAEKLAAFQSFTCKKCVRQLSDVAEKMQKLLQAYAVVELHAFYELFEKQWSMGLSKRDFLRYVYWYGAMGQNFETYFAETEDICYVGSLSLNIEQIHAAREMFAKNLPYKEFDYAFYKRDLEDISAYGEGWLELAKMLDAVFEIDEETLLELFEELLCMVLSGDAISDIYEFLTEISIKLEQPLLIIDHVNLWLMFMNLMLSTGLPMLNGYSRMEYEQITGEPALAAGVFYSEQEEELSPEQSLFELPSELQANIIQAYFTNTGDDEILAINAIRKNLPVENDEIDAFLACCCLDVGNQSKGISILERLAARTADESVEAFLYGMKESLLEKSKETSRQEELTTEMPYRRETPKIGRNDPCPCGSGKKYKKCCGRK